MDVLGVREVSSILLIEFSSDSDFSRSGPSITDLIYVILTFFLSVKEKKNCKWSANLFHLNISYAVLLKRIKRALCFTAAELLHYSWKQLSNVLMEKQ